MQSHYFRFGFILIFLLCVRVAYGQPAGELLIYNVKVIDVETGAIQDNAAVRIKALLIEEVGESNALLKKAAKNDQVIDGRGKYLIPGLWDMHVHLEGADLVEDNKALLPIFLAYGITTVRDCASDLGEQVLTWRQEIASGKTEGPTIYTAGRKLEGKNSIWKGDLEIENETELKQMLDLLDTYKVDFVKITENTLAGDLFKKSVQAAHQRGYRVSGHVPIDATIMDLVDAGYTSVEHASYLLRLGSDETSIVRDLNSGRLTRSEAEARYANQFNQERAFKGYQALAAKRVFVCPTLIGGRQLAFLTETDHSKDEMLNYLTNAYVANYQWRIQRMAGDTEEQMRQRKERYALLMKQIPIFQKAGLKIIAGSDAAALNTYVYPAESLIQELEIFQEAGLTPLQVLQTATRNGPSYFDADKKIGIIKSGALADLVLLDENPLVDVKGLRKINAVVKRGSFYSREKLDQLLKTAREAKVRLDAQRK